MSVFIVMPLRINEQNGQQQPLSFLFFRAIPIYYIDYLRWFRSFLLAIIVCT